MPVDNSNLLEIDKHNLDEEIIRQPVLFQEVADACAEAESERDFMKHELGVIDAKIDGEVRAELQTKATEGMVKSRIQADKRHVAAFTDWLEAKKRSDKLEGLKESLKQRSYALRGLVALYTSSYYEEAAQRSTPAQDKLVYSKQRARLASKRDQLR